MSNQNKKVRKSAIVCRHVDLGVRSGHVTDLPISLVTSKKVPPLVNRGKNPANRESKYTLAPDITWKIQSVVNPSFGFVSYSTDFFRMRMSQSARRERDCEKYLFQEAEPENPSYVF